MAGRIAYYGNIATQGLVLNLDAAIQGSYPKTGSTWFDISNNGNNGTLTNGPLYTGSDYEAIVFDGVNDYVTVPNFICTGLGFSGTIEIITNCTGSLIYNERTNNSTGDGYFLVTSSGSLNIGVNANGNPPYTYFLTSSISGNLNQINHYIASYTVPNTSATMSGILGINGVFETLSTPIVVFNAFASFKNVNIGRHINYIYGTSYSSPGSVYIVRIYNRRLSQSEMLQNYNAVRGRYGI